MNQTSDQSIHIDSGTSIPAALNYWEIYLTDQPKSKYTVKSFLGDLRLMQKFLPPDATIGQITTSDLNRFIDWVEKGRGKNIPCSPKSLARRITSLKSFFSWLSDHGRIPFNPAKEILQRTVISPLPQVLSTEELLKALETARKMMAGEKPDSRPFVLFKLLLDTGIKKSECLNIRLNHVVLGENEKYLFVRYPDQKDRNKERKINLSDEFMNAYHRYIEEYQLTDALFPWSQRRLEYILEDISKAAQIDKHISFSMCRWNSALIDMKSGLERDLIRQKLGISKIQWREIDMKLKELAKNHI